MRDVQLENLTEAGDIPHFKVRGPAAFYLEIAGVLAIFYLGGFLLSTLIPSAESGGRYLIATISRTAAILVFETLLSLFAIMRLSEDRGDFFRQRFLLSGLFGNAVIGIVSGAVLFVVYGLLSEWPLYGGTGADLSIYFKRPDFYLFLGRVFKHLLAPVGEEMFFRGFLFVALVSKAGLLRGTLLSSLIFSLSHLGAADLYTGPQIYRSGWFFLTGVVYCELFRRRKSFYPAIFAHSVYNLLTSLFYLK